MKIYDYHVVALAAGKKMKVRMDQEMICDVVSSLWESHERFLDKINGHDRKLKKAEVAELNNRLFIRAKFAIIDVIRFRTWRGSHSKNSPKHDGVTRVGTRIEYFETLAYNDNAEDAMINNIDISRIREYYMVKEYSLGRTMKEIGKRRSVTEARVSQVFSKLKGVLDEEA